MLILATIGVVILFGTLTGIVVLGLSLPIFMGVSIGLVAVAGIVAFGSVAAALLMLGLPGLILLYFAALALIFMGPLGLLILIPVLLFVFIVFGIPLTVILTITGAIFFAVAMASMLIGVGPLVLFVLVGPSLAMFLIFGVGVSMYFVWDLWLRTPLMPYFALMRISY